MRLALETGEVVQPGGMGETEDSTSNPGPGGGFVLGRSADPGRAWTSAVGGGFQLEEWSLAEGRRIRTADAQLEGMEDPGTAIREGRLPTSLTEAFGVDARGRLWLVFNGPIIEGFKWEDVPLNANGERGISMERMGEFLHTRVEVFDLAARRHVGSLEWDRVNVNLVPAGGTFLLQTVELDERFIPRVAVYEVRFR